MISIILLYDDRTKRAAIDKGFVEQTVLVKQSGCESNDENKRTLERELFNLHPFQFIVGDYWGACND